MTTPISTQLTKLFNITSPIVSAPMAFATTPALVASVIDGGGLGFLAAGLEPTHKIAEALDQARAALSKDKQHLVGVGFLGWVLDKFNTEADPRLITVLDKEPAAVWFAFGHNLGKYVAQVRAHDADHDHKTLVFITVNTVEEAVRAANRWKADVIVAQGEEAGGHASISSPPTEELLRLVLEAIPSGPPILAAGGISTGTQIASLLAKGAAGVVLGTRFLFTNECMFTDEMKKVLVEAGPGSTTRNPAFDLAFDLLHPSNAWPRGIEARCVSNGVVADYENGLSQADKKAHLLSGKEEYLLVWAGTGVKDLNKIESTADVMKSLHNETVVALKASAPELLL
ncbi:2-nitropropane dioxygenase [Laetiporus sulphureus 93-53]|uniref:2-nitropropane dioxygenase n=1 Tax=Laetiporus sulphureus 93-53 TaxID=1314785 RepID=A0A165D5Z4_9APHY|nr:2-nitropropane dioxygenase [Laetiporus sulphureus 93-53]KZT04212.1 2-nitropropane dioxygenase [Laetiporus sulphureus 93-53]